MIYLTILLGVLVLVFGYSTFRLMVKVEWHEDNVIEWEERINVCIQKMHDIDINGAFEADDEVGWVFRDLKKLVEELNEEYEFRN